MAGHTPWREIRGELDETKVADERARAKQEISDFEATLADVRRARGFTQTQLGRALGVSQSEISQLERRNDLYLSTLASYVAAMGGKLALVAAFGNRRVELELGDLAAETTGALALGTAGQTEIGRIPVDRQPKSGSAAVRRANGRTASRRAKSRSER
ncbi:MAG: hypothetical protein NVSMB25_24930 [Thermoleophilaceae bacterium]